MEESQRQGRRELRFCSCEAHLALDTGSSGESIAGAAGGKDEEIAN